MFKKLRRNLRNRFARKKNTRKPEDKPETSPNDGLPPEIKSIFRKPGTPNLVRGMVDAYTTPPDEMMTAIGKVRDTVDRAIQKDPRHYGPMMIVKVADMTKPPGGNMYELSVMLSTVDFGRQEVQMAVMSKLAQELHQKHLVPLAAVLSCEAWMKEVDKDTFASDKIKLTGEESEAIIVSGTSLLPRSSYLDFQVISRNDDGEIVPGTWVGPRPHSKDNAIAYLFQAFNAMIEKEHPTVSNAYPFFDKLFAELGIQLPGKKKRENSTDGFGSGPSDLFVQDADADE